MLTEGLISGLSNGYATIRQVHHNLDYFWVINAIIMIKLVLNMYASEGFSKMGRVSQRTASTFAIFVIFLSASLILYQVKGIWMPAIEWFFDLVEGI